MVDRPRNDRHELGLQLQRVPRGFVVKKVLPLGVCGGTRQILEGDILVSLDGCKLAKAPCIPLFGLKGNDVTIEVLRKSRSITFKVPLPAFPHAQPQLSPRSQTGSVSSWKSSHASHHASQQARPDSRLQDSVLLHSHDASGNDMDCLIGVSVKSSEKGKAALRTSTSSGYTRRPRSVGPRTNTSMSDSSRFYSSPLRRSMSPREQTRALTPSKFVVPDALLLEKQQRDQKLADIIDREQGEKARLKQQQKNLEQKALQKSQEKQRWPGLFSGDDNVGKMGGGRFNASNPKSDLEWIIYRAKSIPGPGDYNTRKEEIVNSGGKFNQSAFLRHFDQVAFNAGKLPGPGDYVIPGSPEIKGGHFSMATPKTEVEVLMDQARNSPGPANYSTGKNIVPEAGGRISRSRTKTELEEHMARASYVPGPCEYNPTLEASNSGRKFSKSCGKTDLDFTILKASRQPGPADYNNAPSTKPFGGRINQARALSEIERSIVRAAKLPGPGHVRIRAPSPKPGGMIAKSGHEFTKELEKAWDVPGPGNYDVPLSQDLKGGRFAASSRTSHLDDLIHRASSIPGVATYEPAPVPLPKGGRFNTSNSRSEIENLILKASRQPGPSDYSVVKGPTFRPTNVQQKGQLEDYFPETKMLRSPTKH